MAVHTVPKVGERRNPQQNKTDKLTSVTQSYEMQIPHIVHRGTGFTEMNSLSSRCREREVSGGEERGGEENLPRQCILQLIL